MAERRTKYVLTAEDRTKAAFNSVAGGLRDIDGRVLGLGAAFTGLFAAAGAGGFLAITKGAIDAQDEIGKLSQRVGLTTESLSALDYSAKLSDVSTESLGNALKKLSVNMLEMQAGTGEAKEAFKALKIEVETTEGALKSNEQVLFDIADRFAAMEDGAGKTALAVKLFGRAGADLIPLLNQGAEGLRKNADEARHYGLIISGDAARAAEEFNDNLTRLQEQLRGVGLAFSSAVLPQLNDFLQAVLDAQKATGGLAAGLNALFNVGSFGEGPAEQIRNIEKELEKLEKTTSFLPFTPLALKLRESSLLNALAVARANLQRQKLGADFDDEALPPARTAGPRLGGKDDAAAKSAKKALDQYLKIANLREQDAERQRAEFAELQKYLDAERAKRDEIVEAVRRQLDPTRALVAEQEKLAQLVRFSTDADEAELLETRIEAIAIQLNDMREGNAAANEELARMIELGKQLARSVQTPSEAMSEQFEIWDRLLAKGAISFETFMRLHAQFEEDAIGVSERFKDADKAARDFGNAVSTAFEDAIIQGKELDDVVKSLGQTIAQIFIRKTITKPLEDAIGSFDLGSIFSDFVGSFDKGTDYVPRTGFAVVHKGERIITAAENRSGAGGGSVTIDARTNVDARGASRDAIPGIVAALETHQRHLERLLTSDNVRRGGAARRFAKV